MPKSSAARRDLTVALDASARAAGFTLSDAQLAVRERLLVLGDELLAPRARRRRPRSLYVWGDAGRGKSWLLDAFFNALPVEAKRRVHFHDFFDQLHRQIHARRGTATAVDDAVRALVDGATLLFFDEFHVHDAGDAALLIRLLRSLVAQDVVLLTSSNYPPAGLLPDPLWHHLFEPGIELILATMEIVRLEGDEDYRARPHRLTSGFAAGRWVAPASDRQVRDAGLDRPRPEEATVLLASGRRFPILAQRAGEVWLSFEQLCATPTSSLEYLRRTRDFAHWVVTDVGAFAAAGADAQQRFITVIDILCDAEVRLTILSPLPGSAFAAGASRRPDTFRMLSRLQLLQGFDSTPPAVRGEASRATV